MPRAKALGVFYEHRPRIAVAPFGSSCLLTFHRPIPIVAGTTAGCAHRVSRTGHRSSLRTAARRSARRWRFDPAGAALAWSKWDAPAPASPSPAERRACVAPHPSAFDLHVPTGFPRQLAGAEPCAIPRRKRACHERIHGPRSAAHPDGDRRDHADGQRSGAAP
jgi:hypothetical protein